MIAEPPSVSLIKLIEAAVVLGFVIVPACVIEPPLNAGIALFVQAKS